MRGRTERMYVPIPEWRIILASNPSRIIRPLEAAAQQGPEVSPTVPPGDLLAFGVGAAAVGDGRLVDAQMPFADAGGHFRLEAEAVGLERDGAEDVGAEGLVAASHVGQVDVVEDVGQESEETI